MIDEIVSIEEVGMRDLIDIEVTGNHLFYANDILTHNSNTDVGLEDTSESFGLPATADFMFALISNEELENLGQIMVKQLKNRYNDLGHNKRFVIGVDRSKMKLYDVEAAAQTLVQGGAANTSILDTPPINSFGDREKKDFSNFKM
jgi:hypothetical protein